MTSNHVAGLIGMIVLGLFILVMMYMFWTVFVAIVLAALGFLKWFAGLSVADFFSHIGAGLVGWGIGRHYQRKKSS